MPQERPVREIAWSLSEEGTFSLARAGRRRNQGAWNSLHWEGSRLQPENLLMDILPAPTLLPSWWDRLCASAPMAPSWSPSPLPSWWDQVPLHPRLSLQLFTWGPRNTQLQQPPHLSRRWLETSSLRAAVPPLWWPLMPGDVSQLILL